jgi:hypothetical protein
MDNSAIACVSIVMIMQYAFMVLGSFICEQIFNDKFLPGLMVGIFSGNIILLAVLVLFAIFTFVKSCWNFMDEYTKQRRATTTGDLQA